MITTLTLADLNAHRESEWVWSDTYRLKSEYGVGGVGYMHAGSKIHLVIAERVTEVMHPDQAKPNHYKVGQIFSAGCPCNSNGQNVGRVYARFDLKDITCKTCARVVERLAARHQAR